MKKVLLLLVPLVLLVTHSRAATSIEEESFAFALPGGHVALEVVNRPAMISGSPNQRRTFTLTRAGGAIWSTTDDGHWKAAPAVLWSRDAKILVIGDRPAPEFCSLRVVRIGEKVSAETYPFDRLGEELLKVVKDKDDRVPVQMWLQDLAISPDAVKANFVFGRTRTFTAPVTISLLAPGSPRLGKPVPVDVAEDGSLHPLTQGKRAR